MLRALGSSLRRWGSSVSAQQQPHQQACCSRLVGSSSAVQGGPDAEHGYDHTPTVFDRLVTINVVDLDGKRRSVRGVAGQTLAQVLVEAGYPRVRVLWVPVSCFLLLSLLLCSTHPPLILLHCCCCCPAVLLLPQHGLLHPAHRECAFVRNVHTLCLRAY